MTVQRRKSVARLSVAPEITITRIAIVMPSRAGCYFRRAAQWDGTAQQCPLVLLAACSLGCGLVRRLEGPSSSSWALRDSRLVAIGEKGAPNAILALRPSSEWCCPRDPLRRLKVCLLPLCFCDSKRYSLYSSQALKHSIRLRLKID